MHCIFSGILLRENYRITMWAMFEWENKLQRSQLYIYTVVECPVFIQVGLIWFILLHHCGGKKCWITVETKPSSPAGVCVRHIAPTLDHPTESSTLSFRGLIRSVSGVQQQPADYLLTVKGHGAFPRRKVKKNEMPNVWGNFLGMHRFLF